MTHKQKALTPNF